MKPTVAQMMETETHAVTVDLPIQRAIDVLIEQGVTGIPVVNEHGRVLGVLSEEHCLELIARGDADSEEPMGTVGSYFDPSVPRVTPEMDIYYVAGMFLRQRQYRRFPVVDGDELVGVITRKDVLRALRNLLH